MKLRESEKVHIVALPKKIKEKFTQPETEMVLSLRANGHTHKDIALMVTEKYGIPRTPAVICNKLKSLGEKGVPKFKKSEVYATYEVPDNTSQMIGQMELAFTLMNNCKKFIEKVQHWERDYLEVATRLKKIEGMFGKSNG